MKLHFLQIQLVTGVWSHRRLTLVGCNGVVDTVMRIKKKTNKQAQEYS